jgi:hypothetical protein
MNEFYKYLDSVKITPNAFHILWCIKYTQKGIIPNPTTEIRILQSGKLISDDYKITPEGSEILKDGEELLYAVKKPAKNAVIIEDLDHYIDKYLSIFPAGKLPSGKAARVNKKTLSDAFNWFFKNYTYDWDTILRAAFYYVETYEKDKFRFMKNSQYFIRKQNTDKSWDSELADYCEIILQGEQEEPNHFSDNVV